MRGTALWRISTGILGVVIGATGCGAARPQAAGRETAGAALATHQPARKAAAPSATTRLGGVPVGGPAPAGFAATSVTFVSPREAFVLGSAPCARRPCTSIVRTVNRGETWRGLPAPVVPLRWPGASRPAVWGIRFGTPEHGFVFGNGLWETRDGGEHWTRDVWRHGSIISLAVVDRQVLALTDRCARGGCGSNAVLLRRPLAGGRWRVAAYAGAPDVINLTDVIATWGGMAAVLAGSKVLVTADGGRTFRGHATPCVTIRTGVATSVAVSSRSQLALLCVGEGFTGHTRKWVYVSRDGGVTWARRGQPSTVGDGGVISDAGAGRLTIATASAASWLFRSADGGARWSTVRAELDGGLGWADLGFTTRTDGVVVRGPVYTDGNPDHRPGWLLLTEDAGARWRRVRF